MSIRKPLIVAGFCFAVILAATTTADAQKGRRKGAVQNPNVPLVSQLHATIAALKKADRDYKGHRVKAIQHVHVAVKALAGGKHAHAKVAPGTGKLPQSQSDGILQKAMQNLSSIQTAIANTQGPGNRVAAVAAIQNAIRELQTALKIR